MNRKKAILLVAAIETILLVISTLLFFLKIIPFHIFIIAALLIGFVSSTAMLIVVRKFKP